MDRNDILNSGLLELYAMGKLEGSEKLLLEISLENDPVLKKTLEEIEEVMMQLAMTYAIPPPLAAKPLLMAKIDYMERMKNGEILSPVPVLNHTSRAADFNTWLSRPDMVLPDDFDGMHARIIAQEEDKFTALVWLAHGAPDETHTAEHEKFLIIEGSCDITVGKEVNHLHAGDYFAIPLHVNHYVNVTSSVPCKIILQRVSA